MTPLGAEEALIHRLNTALEESADHGPCAALIGVTVGNYRVERALGRGGAADVYLLRHRQLTATCVAMKVLRGVKLAPGQLDDEVASGERTGEESLQAVLVSRFKQEAQVAAALGSPRVAAALDLGQLADGTPYILMEYVPGLSLHDRLAQAGALPIRESLTIAQSVAETLALAHALGVVHRDIKPANVMLSNDGRVRLLDFGVARVSGALQVVHTTGFVALGTPGYIPPETLAGYEADASADVFSLGVTLFKMLTNALPYPTHTSFASAAEMMKIGPPSVASRRSTALDPVPTKVEQLLRRMLHVDPRRRPGMASLCLELDARQTDTPGSPSRKVAARAAAAAGIVAASGLVLTLGPKLASSIDTALRVARSTPMARLNSLPLPAGTRPFEEPVRSGSGSAGGVEPSSESAIPGSAAAHKVQYNRSSRPKLVDPVDWMEE